MVTILKRLANWLRSLLSRIQQGPRLKLDPLVDIDAQLAELRRAHNEEQERLLDTHRTFATAKPNDKPVQRFADALRAKAEAGQINYADEARLLFADRMNPELPTEEVSSEELGYAKTE